MRPRWCFPYNGIDFRQQLLCYAGFEGEENLQRLKRTILKTYKFISDNVEWSIIEEDKFISKQAIIDNCEQVSNYFKSVITDFKTLNIIADDNKVVINGTAEFLRDNKRVSFVSACDIYEFNKKSQLQKITSYCIQSK